MIDRAQIDFIHEKDKAHDAMWQKINDKIDKGSFRWLFGMLVVVLVGFAGFQWSTYATVTDTRTQIAEIKTKLEARSSIDEQILKHLLEDK